MSKYSDRNIIIKDNFKSAQDFGEFKRCPICARKMPKQAVRCRCQMTSEEQRERGIGPERKE